MTFPSTRTRTSLLVAALLAMTSTAGAQNNPFASMVTPGSNNTPSNSTPPPKPAQDIPRPAPNPFAGLPVAVQNGAAPKPQASQGPGTSAGPTAITASTTPAAAGHPQAQLGVLEQRNVFDPKRVLWPDRIPPPPVPPPPPPPPPITDADMQLYGVVLAGNVKRATVKVGGKFAGLAQGKRPFLTVMEGQVLGEYTVGEIRANELVMLAGTGRQTVVFTKKTDRPTAGAAAPPVVQAAQVAAPTALQAPQAPLNPMGVGLPTPAAPTNTQPAPVADGGATAPQANTPAATAAPAASPAVSAASIAPPNSLAAAIAAAQAAAQAGKPPAANPFTAP